MKRLLPALLCIAAATAACGDFSQDDLLFLAAVPSSQTVELRPAGAKGGGDDDGQALTRACARDDLRCSALQIATGMNKVTFDVLEAIDRVSRQQPSLREKNRRVWGPFFDDKALSTFRFEMIRSKDGGTFAFCLHAKAGAVRWGAADDITCEDQVHDKSGLELFLEGQFSPGSVKGAAARTGVGDMSIHTGRFRDVATFADRLDIRFDNDDERTEIDADLVGVPVENTNDKRDAAYSFQREQDGSGLFAFEAFADFVQPVQGVGPEHLSIKAAWKADQSGRADAKVDEGDAPDNVITHQCWDADQETTWLAPFDADPTGNESTCVIPDALIQ